MRCATPAGRVHDHRTLQLAVAFGACVRAPIRDRPWPCCLQCLATCAGVKVKSEGKCPPACACPFILAPVCGVNGKT